MICCNKLEKPACARFLGNTTDWKCKRIYQEIKMLSSRNALLSTLRVNHACNFDGLSWAAGPKDGERQLAPLAARGAPTCPTKGRKPIRRTQSMPSSLACPFSSHWTTRSIARPPPVLLLASHLNDRSLYTLKVYQIQNIKLRELPFCKLERYTYANVASFQH